MALGRATAARRRRQEHRLGRRAPRPLEATLRAETSRTRRVARSVVCSSLAKSAVFSRDPNWGRLAAAAGYSGVDFDQETLKISLGPHLLMDKGQPLPFDENAASAYLAEKGEHGTVRVDVSPSATAKAPAQPGDAT